MRQNRSLPFPLLPGTRGVRWRRAASNQFPTTKLSPYTPLLQQAFYLELLKISVMISDRELRSLGIRTTGTSKRKRNRSSSKKGKILRTNASDLSAPAMNQSSDIFVDFSAKIRRVLEYPDRDVVLSNRT